MKSLLLAVALLPLAVHAQSANVVAGLQEDVSALRDEVRKLREEVAELKEAQTALAAKTPAAPAAGDVNARIAAMDTAQSAARRADKAELLAEINRRSSALETNVNKALAEQTRQVNAALKSGAASTPAPHVPKPATPPSKPVEAPADMPKAGVRYRVQPGDSVTKIAKKMNSKSSWILGANNLRSNADLKAHSEIFIPQSESAPEEPAKAE